MFSRNALTVMCVSCSLLSACSGLVDAPVVRALVAPDVRVDPAALKPGTYTLDPAHAYLDFSVSHMELSELKGRFDNFDLTLTVPSDDLTEAGVTARIDTSSLFLATQNFSEALKRADWFSTEAFPEAVFKSDAVTLTGPLTGTVHGMLTLKGQTRPVALDVVFHGGAENALTGRYTLGFSATGTFNRSDFDLGRYLAFVSDPVVIRFSGEFQRS